MEITVQNEAKETCTGGGEERELRDAGPEEEVDREESTDNAGIEKGAAEVVAESEEEHEDEDAEFAACSSFPTTLRSCTVSVSFCCDTVSDILIESTPFSRPGACSVLPAAVCVTLEGVAVEEEDELASLRASLEDEEDEEEDADEADTGTSLLRIFSAIIMLVPLLSAPAPLPISLHSTRVTISFSISFAFDWWLRSPISAKLLAGDWLGETGDSSFSVITGSSGTRAVNAGK